MRRTFDERMVSYAREKTSWERRAAQKRKELEEAERITKYAAAVTPDAQASIFPAYFIRDHFLSRGQPDPQKRPAPVTLTNYTGGFPELVKEIMEVPGLCYAREGEDPKWVYCIGWNKATVDAAAVDLDKEIKNTLWAEEWDRLVSEEGYKQIKALPLAGFPDHRTLENCLGHFAVIIPAFRNIFREYNILSFGASHRDGDVVVVKFDMRLLMGTLIFAVTTDALDRYCQRYTDPELAAHSSSRSPDRKKRRIKDEPDADPVLQPNDAGKFKLFFRFRGVETVNNTNIVHWTPLEGDLTFQDRSFRKLRGHIDFSGAWGLGRVRLKGTRLAWEALERAPGWNDFTQAAAQQDDGNKEVIVVDDA